MQPLTSTILDLDHALGGNAGLIIGGGLGLYLKQQQLQESGIRTLLGPRALPAARTTKDIDLFLRAEVVARAAQFEQMRAVLQSLAFRPVETAKFVKFQRTLAGVELEIDIMMGPKEGHAGEIRIESERARPLKQDPKIELHARYTPDALGIEKYAAACKVSGIRSSDGRAGTCEIKIPCSFTYAMMKLGALHDRIDDLKKDEGRHHAMDLYRIVGLQTEEEVALGERLAKEFAGDPQLHAARDRIEPLFATRTSAGSLRLLEYQSVNRGVPPINLDWFVSELRRLLTAT